MRALIAEDDPVTRRLLEAHLSKWGHEVVPCSNGAEAWEILKREDSPSLVILDWMMPEISGLLLCRKIRKLQKEAYVYIILLTGRNRKEDVIEGLEAGADDYITKPFDPNELKVRVRAGARIAQLHEALISALKTSEFQASHDALTGLWNRAAILEILEKELARSKREGTPVGVVIADLDHFKQINDRYSHLAGDAVLREVAQRINSCVRSYDFVGRYGGEEFIIVLPGCDRDASGQMAERLRLGFDSDPVNTPEGTFNVTMSLGVTSVQGGSDTSIKRVIRSADEALYRAKNSGRNRVELSFANVVPVLQAGTARPSHAEPVSVPSRKPLQPLAKWSRGEPMT